MNCQNVSNVTPFYQVNRSNRRMIVSHEWDQIESLEELWTKEWLIHLMMMISRSDQEDLFFTGELEKYAKQLGNS